MRAPLQRARSGAGSSKLILSIDIPAFGRSTQNDEHQAGMDWGPRNRPWKQSAYITVITAANVEPRGCEIN